VTVAVTDAKTGEAFELPVPKGERALEVFHTPTHTPGGHCIGVSPSRPLIRRSDDPERRKRCDTTPRHSLLSLSQPLEVR
jgi:hypothetical protein